MQCGKCGGNLEENAVLCKSCGERVEKHRRLRFKEIRNKKTMPVVIGAVIVLLAVLLLCLTIERVPSGMEALIYRYWEGIEQDDYTQWEYFYDKNLKAKKDDNGILPCMDGDEDGEYWTSSYLHRIHQELTYTCGEGFKVTYKINGYEELTDWEMIEFSQRLIDKYNMNLTYKYFPGMHDLYQKCVGSAYLYNIDIVIKDAQGNYTNLDGCEYVIYYTDNHWMIEEYSIPE